MNPTMQLKVPGSDESNDVVRGLMRPACGKESRCLAGICTAVHVQVGPDTHYCASGLLKRISAGPGAGVVVMASSPSTGEEGASDWARARVYARYMTVNHRAAPHLLAGCCTVFDRGSRRQRVALHPAENHHKGVGSICASARNGLRGTGPAEGEA